MPRSPCHLVRVHQQSQRCGMGHLKRLISSLGITSQLEPISTSLRNISSHNRSTSTPVTPFNGGTATACSSPISRDLQEIYWQYPVHVSVIGYCYAVLMRSLGSAVAVERIFSGGRDTISLRRASLKPDTIRTLMVVKQRLRLARTTIQELLGDSDDS
jgi:hypothetical protein